MQGRNSSRRNPIGAAANANAHANANAYASLPYHLRIGAGQPQPRPISFCAIRSATTSAETPVLALSSQIAASLPGI